MFPKVIDRPQYILDTPSGRPPKTFKPEQLMEQPLVLRKMGWQRAEQIDQAMAFGFPGPIRYRIETRRGQAIRHPLYSESQINEWIDRVRGLLAGLA